MSAFCRGPDYYNWLEKIINMKTKNTSFAFTLVEVLVAMTIFSIIMVSVFMIYASSVQISIKADINREMQQNIKSVIERISNDIRKNGITGVSESVLVYWTGAWDWSALKVWNNFYFLSDYGDIISGDFDIRKSNIDECTEIKNTCWIVQKWVWPLSNSKVSFTDLHFYVTRESIPKVTITFTVKPSTKKWLRAELVKSSTTHFQTTISEQTLQVK